MTADGFQSQSGVINICDLLVLAPNNPQRHLWFPGVETNRESLTCEVRTIPSAQPDINKDLPAFGIYVDLSMYFFLGPLCNEYMEPLVLLF